MIDVLLLAFGC